MTDLANERPVSTKSFPTYLFYGVIALLVGLGLGWLILQSGFVPMLSPAPAFNGFVLEGPDILGEFELIDGSGNAAFLSDYRGQVTVVYYGYTYCPDVCPSTMVELNDMLEALESRSSQVQVMLVSVDPERDQPERLNEYVTYFNPEFIGLTGTEEQLVAATVPYGIFYEKHGNTSSGNYLIDHSAGVLVFDKDGYLRLMFPYGLSGEKMAEDVRYFTSPWRFK